LNEYNNVRAKIYYKNIFADYLTNGNVVDAPYKSGQTNGNKGTLIVHSQRVSFLSDYYAYFLLHEYNARLIWSLTKKKKLRGGFI